MKRVIRRGVFETNSSSMHSIVVTNNDIKNVSTKDYFWVWKSPCNSKISFWGSDIEFGRSPFDVLGTAYDKLKYALRL